MALEAEDVGCRGTDVGRVFTMVIFMGRDRVRVSPERNLSSSPLQDTWAPAQAV